MSIDISIKNVGPVVELEASLPTPGVYVLKGRNGCGKTTTLRTVELVTNGRTDIVPTKTDGEKRGEATVAGKTLRITSQIRSEGELGVEGIGDLDLASLHTPKFLQAETRDRHRIKALARLAGVQANASLFHEVCGGPELFAQLVDAEFLKTDDIVEMAAGVKRSLEKHAQRKEEEERNHAARAAASAAICEGVNLDAPHDETQLRDAMAAAIAEKTRIETRRRDGLAARQRGDLAQSKIIAERAKQTTPIETLRESLASASAAQSEAEANLEDVRRLLANAERDLERARHEHGAARQALSSAEQLATAIAAWQADIDAAAAIPVPSEDDVRRAASAAEAATNATVEGGRIRNARKAKEQADEAHAAAKKAASTAKRLREAAADVHDVLADAIGKVKDCPLRVRADNDGNPRLVIETDRDADECFDELSDGERWPILIRLAAGRNRLIVLPQAAFGELSPAMRDLIDNVAKDTGSFILTAVADDEPLRCEAWKA